MHVFLPIFKPTGRLRVRIQSNPTESPVINAACSAGNEKNYIQLALMLKELEAKLKDTEKQFEKKLANLRSEIQGKIILHC